MTAPKKLDGPSLARLAETRNANTRFGLGRHSGANVGDNINMVIKVNWVLYVRGHIRENVAGAWQKFSNEEFLNGK